MDLPEYLSSDALNQISSKKRTNLGEVFHFRRDWKEVRFPLEAH